MAVGRNVIADRQAKSEFTGIRGDPGDVAGQGRDRAGCYELDRSLPADECAGSRAPSPEILLELVFFPDESRKKPGFSQ